MDASRNMTLGALIEALRPHAKDDARVSIAGLGPVSGIASYRGYYDQVALVIGHPGHNAGSLLRALEAAASGNETYYGWKGGEYTYSKSTPVWVVLGPGSTSEATPAGVARVDDTVVISIGVVPW